MTDTVIVNGEGETKVDAANGDVEVAGTGDTHITNVNGNVEVTGNGEVIINHLESHEPGAQGPEGPVGPQGPTGSIGAEGPAVDTAIWEARFAALEASILELESYHE